MKSILLLLLSLLLPPQFSNKELYGKWKLVKIEISGKTLFPQKKDYYLVLTEKNISYNLEVNRCGTEDFIIDDTEIFLTHPFCTEICCDGHYDTISNYIDYNGKYELKEPLLIIINNRGKLYLIRNN